MRPRIDIRFVTMPGLDAGPTVARVVWFFSKGHGGAACPLQPQKSGCFAGYSRAPGPDQGGRVPD